MSDANGNLSETLSLISANRTLIAKKMTGGEALKPEVVHGLQTVEQVFDHYKPAINFRFEDAAGFTRYEELKFKTLDDFSLSNIAGQSHFLTQQTAKKKFYLKLAAQLKTNQLLRDVLANADKRRVFEAMVKSMIKDIKK
jgi:predicted component of type VI protein secretion system